MRPSQINNKAGRNPNREAGWDEKRRKGKGEDTDKKNPWLKNKTKHDKQTLKVWIFHKIKADVCLKHVISFYIDNVLHIAFQAPTWNVIIENKNTFLHI